MGKNHASQYANFGSLRHYQAHIEKMKEILISLPTNVLQPFLIDGDIKLYHNNDLQPKYYYLEQLNKIMILYSKYSGYPKLEFVRISS